MTCTTGNGIAMASGIFPPDLVIWLVFSTGDDNASTITKSSSLFEIAGAFLPLALPRLADAPLRLLVRVRHKHAIPMYITVCITV